MNKIIVLSKAKKEEHDINTRKVEIFIGGEWKEAHPSQIRINDKIRVYEPGGEPFLEVGSHEIAAVSDSYVVDGVWTVKCKQC